MGREFYARPENGRGEKQSVERHVKGVRELCEEYAREAVGDCVPGRIMGTYHDLGKVSQRFQGVLAHTETHVDHALPGSAVMAYTNIVMPNKKNNPLGEGCDWHQSPAWPAVCAARNHHGKLNWYCDEEIKEYMKGGFAFGKKPAFLWDSEEKKEALRYYTAHGLLCKERVGAPEGLRLEGPRERMMYTRMLFSSLVDADYTDAASHEDTEYLKNASVPMFDVEKSWEKLCEIREDLNKEDSTMNRIRNQVFEACAAAGEKAGDGVYTMTAPTGSGKTFGMAAFALKKLAQADNTKKRVIVVLPYHTIIEQNAAVFRQFVPEVTEIHGQAETTRELSSRWDAPFIVTTSVQFFESLFSCEGPKCRKLHRFANAVILFDECQTLPSELAGETITALRILSKDYHSTILFSTGTQPRFDALRGYEEISGWKPQEIIPDSRKMFRQVKRVEVEWRMGDEKLDSITQELICKKDVCMIVNLKRHAELVFDLVLEKIGTKEDLYLLTGNMPPAQRSEILREMEEKRKNGVPCILVATQCIEAGVDVSFPYMYRVLAPLEAIMQAAGRCNRHGEYGAGYLTVFRFEEDAYPSTYYEIAARTTEAVYVKHGGDLDICNKDILGEYYQMLYRRSVSGGNTALKKAVEEMDFERVEELYHLIPNNSVRVITPYNEKFFSELCEEAKNGVNNKWIRKATPYTVSVYDRKWVEENCEQVSVKKPDGSFLPVPYYLCTNLELFDRERKGLLVG